MQSSKIITNNINDTKRLAGELAASLKGGEVVCLYGELGAGKTVFVQGMMEYFLPGKRVLSPTFIIVRHYTINHKTIKKFLHIDLYRLSEQKEIRELEFLEYLNNSEIVVAIEWAEKMQNLLPKQRIDIRIETLSNDNRMISISHSGDFSPREEDSRI